MVEWAMAMIGLWAVVVLSTSLSCCRDSGGRQRVAVSLTIIAMMLGLGIKNLGNVLMVLVVTSSVGCAVIVLSVVVSCPLWWMLLDYVKDCRQLRDLGVVGLMGVRLTLTWLMTLRGVLRSLRGILRSSANLVNGLFAGLLG